MIVYLDGIVMAEKTQRKGTTSYRLRLMRDVGRSRSGSALFGAMKAIEDDIFGVEPEAIPTQEIKHGSDGFSGRVS